MSSNNGLRRGRERESGASLIVVMLILIVVSILGVGGIQISMMGEKSTRNDRDKQIAWQAAEAALLDAEFDILGLPKTSSSSRASVFTLGNTDISQFISGCGSTGNTLGLCEYAESSKPAWLTVNFEETGKGAATTPFGSFTGRSYPAGALGIQSAKPPRYVIESIPDPSDSRTKSPSERHYVYRVTAMGFGPNADTQVVLQMIYRN